MVNYVRMCFGVFFLLNLSAFFFHMHICTNVIKMKDKKKNPSEEQGSSGPVVNQVLVLESGVQRFHVKPKVNIDLEV